MNMLNCLVTPNTRHQSRHTSPPHLAHLVSHPGRPTGEDHEQHPVHRCAVDQFVFASGHQAGHRTRSGIDMLQVRAGYGTGRIPWCHEPGRCMVIHCSHRPKHPLPSPTGSTRLAQGACATSGFTGRRSRPKAAATRVHGARKHVVIGGRHDVNTCRSSTQRHAPGAGLRSTGRPGAHHTSPDRAQPSGRAEAVLQ